MCHVLDTSSAAAPARTAHLVHPFFTTLRAEMLPHIQYPDVESHPLFRIQIKILVQYLGPISQGLTGEIPLFFVYVRSTHGIVGQHSAFFAGQRFATFE